ncbi:MAG: aminotransferase class V-fold PLP-dependent enzyme [Xanthomonadales bacterium]|nr:aminotransferase class V-fold PLP-dependent enzyme [Xanthomonadales bacterium]
MPPLDIDFVRSQFPAFSEPSLEGFAHFENAGGSYACGQVIEWLDHYYRRTKLQPRYDFAPSRHGGEAMTRARQRMAAWLGVDEDEVSFGPSTTQNTYVVAQALRGSLQPGDEIIVTNQDHEANIGCWRRLEADGIVLREWRVDEESGELDPAGLDALLAERTKVVAFTHCSNIVGSVHPVREWVERIHAAGALAFVDGVAFCPHGLPDVAALGADLYTFSLYKVYGPHQGIMVMRKALNEALPNQGHFFNSGIANKRFTPAGPDHAQVAATNGVMDYFEALDKHHGGNGGAKAPERVREMLHQREQSLLQPLLDFVSGHPRARLIGKSGIEGRAPTVSFAVRGQPASELASKLGRENIGVGVGNCYAYRLIEALGIDPDEGVLRTSLVHYTSEGEVTRLLETLDRLL